MQPPDSDKKPHRHVTAGLIWKDGRLLISRRPRGAHLAGFWEFPGGKQEQGENLRECLKREIKEELGIEARIGEPVLSVEHEYKRKKITLHVFNCTWAKGDPLALQSQEIRWAAPNELSDLLFPPPDRKVIEKLRETQQQKGEKAA